MKTYIGTKIIEAVREDRRTHERCDEGYKVVYPDGYESWSPKDAFEAAYRTSGAFNFGHALLLLNAGRSVARAGWNGKGMFLYLVPPGNYPARTDIAKAHWGDDGLVPYGAYIAMRTAQGNVVPWLASQTDMLGEDWELVE